MTHPDPLTRAVQAALDAAADAADNPARPMDYLMGDRPLSQYDVCIHDNMMRDDCLPCSITAIRAIDPAEVLAKLPSPELGPTVVLTYTNWRGETAQRTITPISLWYGSTDWHPEPQWLLRGWDHAKGADRDFALIDFGHPAKVLAKVPPAEIQTCEKPSSRSALTEKGC